MRIQSHIWVNAFLRRESTDGAFALVLQKGSPEAGAIFIVQNHLDGRFTAWAPAPQSVFGEPGKAQGRVFEQVHNRAPEPEVRSWLERQLKFDPDCWVVETERKDGTPDLFDESM